MGMHGPLTAQALGRSPYDDVVEGEGEEDPRQPTQQYDYRGRPFNPETRRVNREIVRSHNEVMLVIGVAEAENPALSAEAESHRRHEAYEESVGLFLASPAKRCVEAVGIFGINGLRHRILIYKRYSQIPFWELFQAARNDFSLSRDIFAGASSSFFIHYIENTFRRMLACDAGCLVPSRLTLEIWSYIRIHLELHVALQHLGLIPNKLLLPNPKFFIPFTDASPISAPPAPEDFSIPSLLRWLGGAFISTTPFIVWVMAQRMLREWKPQIWSHVFRWIPNTMFRGKKAPPLPPPSLPPPPPLSTTFPGPSQGGNEQQAPAGDEGTQQNGVSRSRGSEPNPTDPGDDYASDEDENEGVSATLISFDVEATESADAPPGLWSAELRPSQFQEPRTCACQHHPLYLDTLLTQLPALIGSHIFTDAITRLVMTPYEATALRLVARTLRLNQGLSSQDIHAASLLSGLSWTTAMNFFATEFLHLVLCGEVWAAFTGISQWFHKTEEEWKAGEAGT
ncbi:hypothetical protein HRG_003168 [Hirsutella rhossiliensis]|uniref:Uncharacterized protein n=1 Tax=Hirsutella rhossiliensis TaxID=111463 RepID=A0A9P8N206_9HYPO|nr:uncharacterized protein HRG_03168 [Hirsutella rhossiliensis]KAH0965152.1 hypothetical protein HRG_03168 [Hirsutella rhossiliensis]